MRKCFSLVRASRLPRRLASLLFRRLSSCPWAGPTCDRWDERRALRLRETLGRQGRLISWGPESNGAWRARLSSAALAHTLERVGRTRSEAIERADRAVTRLLTCRRQFQSPDKPSPPSSDPF